MHADEDPDAEIAAGRKELPGLTLTLQVEPRPFELGEPIPVTMRYAYEGDRRLALSHVTYDRCGRICVFGFEAVDETGARARDPLRDYLAGGMGGIRTEGPLEPKAPYSQEILLNEWLAFDRPGRYAVTAWSHLVHFDPTGSGRPSGPAIPLGSEPVEIVLVEPTQAARDARLQRALSQSSRRSREERERAMQALRFLADVRAIPRLVEGLFDPHGNVQIEALFGLLTFPDLEPVRQAIHERAASGAFDASDVGRLAAILALAELRAAGHEEGWSSAAWRKGYRDVQSEWTRKLRDRLLEHLEDLSGGEKARQLVVAMAMGPAVGRDDPGVWRIVLQHVAHLAGEMGRAASLIESHLRDPAFLPDLRRMAADASLHPALRNAAVIALFAMEDESFSDRLLEDLGQAKPIFYRRAHRLIMGVRGEEAATRLLEAYEAYEDAREDTARRIHDLDAPVVAGTLADLTRAARGHPRRGFGWLLRTLAKRSPEKALPIVRACIARPGFGVDRERQLALEVLADLGLPTAEHLRRQVLLTFEAADRLTLTMALHGAKTATYHVPDLLLLARADPSGPVRSAAEGALADATGLPERGLYGRTRKGHEEAMAVWERWWKENGARYGRWGPVVDGVALRIAASAGVLSAGDRIEITLRLRRVDGAAALRPEVHVLVDEGGRLTPFALLVPDGDPVLLPSAGAEVTYTVRLEDLPRLRRAGTHSIQVAAALRGSGTEPSREIRYVPSGSIFLHVR